MKLRNLTLLALLGGLCFAVACTNDPQPDTNDGFARVDTSVVYPLKIGNEWTYKITTFSPAVKRDTITITTVRDTVIDGKTWALVGNAAYTNPTVYLYRSDPTGAWYYQKETRREIVVCKLPPMIGDTVLGQQAAAVCFVTDTILTLPAGKFKCVGYRDEGVSLSETRVKYFAPGAGEVLVQAFDLANNETWRKELIGYQFR